MLVSTIYPCTASSSSCSSSSAASYSSLSNSPPPMAALAISSCGLRALLVDDNVINRMVVRKLMEEQGIALEEAENGKEAVELIKGGRVFDLILMDREMPVMDGPQATKQLRSLGVTTPIVALSADAMQSDKDSFLQAGADDFVEKPLNTDKFALVLTKYGLQDGQADDQ